jgi:hypothetical protein
MHNPVPFPSHPYTLLRLILLRTLPRKSHFVIRVLRPPEFESNLESNLPIIYHHRGEHHNKRKRRMHHQEDEDGPDMTLPCLLPHKSEDDGQQLEVDSIKESRSRVGGSKRSHRSLGFCSVVLDAVRRRCRGCSTGIKGDKGSEAPVIIASHNRGLRIARRTRGRSYRRLRIRSGLGELESMLAFVTEKGSALEQGKKRLTDRS